MCMPAKSGLNTNGPSAAPATAPKRTSEICLGRRSGGTMSAAAARASSTVPFATPTRAKPRMTSGAVPQRQPSAVVDVPATPTTQPTASTGTRPRVSISRPAGNAASAPAVRKMAGPRPRIPSIPVTTTSVVVATATTSWIVPERQTSTPESRSVLRRTGYALTRAGASARRGTPPLRRAPDAGRTARRSPPGRGARRRSRAGREGARAGTAARLRPRRRSASGSTAPCPGWVGTTFQSTTSSSRPSSARTRWTTVALTSAGPRPVSWRSEVNGIPLTRAPR